MDPAFRAIVTAAAEAMLPDRAAGLIGEIERWFEDPAVAGRCSFCDADTWPRVLCWRGSTSLSVGRVDPPAFRVESERGVARWNDLHTDRLANAVVCSPCVLAGGRKERLDAPAVVADLRRAILAHSPESEWAAIALERRAFSNDCTLCDRRSETLARGRGVDLCPECFSAVRQRLFALIGPA